ncbi:MAG: carboxypeptidase regulatory-like domain-containing protein [Clostridia bacterium]|nr:carboxypeptidase regulatory-like domain-containing protein [Clostridia bacterium]
MKKWIALLILAVLMLCCCGAYAEDDSIRHLVTGDRSWFDVSEELDRAQGHSELIDPTIGTELYLFVDPDTASYVTFYVTDEQGRPIPGAQIYISYGGVEELFGVTDENGRLSTYLFRDTEYGYRVTKSGYEPATGTFVATNETKFIHVVLRRLYDLTIYVVDNGVPQPGVTVIIDGRTYKTDDEGKVTVRKPNGEYNVIVIAPDGRRIPVQAIVSGDTTIVVDIGLDDALVDGGRYSDRFLVYNKFYNPEDYELTYYSFRAEDLTQLEGETDEAFALRTARYLEKHPNTILIEAQPERRQNKDGTDTDKYNADGTPLYAQRSLMPTGYLLKIWEEMGYTDLVFTNEDFGLRLDMQALHTGDMAKLYALIGARESGTYVRDIATQENRRSAAINRLNTTAIKSINVQTVPFDELRTFEFEFDHLREAPGVPGRASHELISDTLYTNTLFEFRITPILHSALEKMLRDGFSGDPAINKDSIMLASPGYFTEELRKLRADGKLTETECSELFAYLTDGILTAQEMQELCEKAKVNLYDHDVIDMLLDASLDEKVYRLSCWIIYGNAKINVTELMDGMLSIWKIDEQFKREYDALMALPDADEKAAKAQAEAALVEKYDLMTVDNLGMLETQSGYAEGINTKMLDVALVCSMPDEEDEFRDLLSRRWFDAITVDVRKEEVTIADNHEQWYRAYFTYDMTQLLERRALVAPNETCGLAALVLTERSPVHPANNANILAR